MGQSLPEDKREGVFAEYAQLRAEILGYQRDALQVLTFVGAVSAFVFATKSGWWLYFLLAMLLCPAVLLQLQRIRSTWRIGRYIQECIECYDIGLCWETTWSNYRSIAPKAAAQYVTQQSKSSLPWFFRLPFLERYAASLVNRMRGWFYSFKFVVTLPIVALQAASVIMMWTDPQAGWWVISAIIIVVFTVFIELALACSVDDVKEIQFILQKVHEQMNPHRKVGPTVQHDDHVQRDEQSDGDATPYPSKA